MQLILIPARLRHIHFVTRGGGGNSGKKKLKSPHAASGE